MKAVVTKAFPGVRDGEVHPVDFKVGDEIEGDLARAAVAADLAEVVKEKAPPSPKAPAPDDLNAKTVEQLNAFAAEKQIDLGEATKKAEIIAAIEAKLKAGAA